MRHWSTNKVAVHLCRGQRGGGDQDLFLVSAPSLPENPARPYPRSLAREGSIEAAHWASPRCHSHAPLPCLRCIGRFAARRYGETWEDSRSEFASRGAPGFAVSVGDTTGSGVAKNPASQVEWSGFSDLRGPGRHPLPGFGLVRGDLRTPKVPGG
jgi:hypothetical protein